MLFVLLGCNQSHQEQPTIAATSAAQVKARIIIYTHDDFNQSQLEAVLLPLVPKQAVLYLRKLATQGHVVVIQAQDQSTLEQYLSQISNLKAVKLFEQDAILSIKEQ